MVDVMSCEIGVVSNLETESQAGITGAVMTMIVCHRVMGQQVHFEIVVV